MLSISCAKQNGPEKPIHLCFTDATPLFGTFMIWQWILFFHLCSNLFFSFHHSLLVALNRHKHTDFNNGNKNRWRS